MKKQLLYTALFFCSSSFAQTLDYSNEPAIGDNKTMYELDPAADPLENNTGTSATWDFSSVLGAGTASKIIEIVDPSSTPNSATFSTSTKAYNAGGALLTYFNSTAASRISQGFVFEEQTLGTVIANFDTDEQTLITYPFAYGDVFSDNFSGTVSYNLGTPATSPCTGKSHATIDGSGTLILANATSISNVIRFKLVDTVYTTIASPLGGNLDIEIIRTQYEYYGNTGTLPVFTYTGIIVQQQGSTTPFQETAVVLSSVQPSSSLGITLNTLTGMSIYPNPSEGSITINGDFTESANARIFDQSGRIVSTINGLMNGQIADLSSLEKGTYMIVITNNGIETTQKVVLK
jgi:hypothetical protein